MRVLFVVIQLVLMIGVPVWLALRFRRKWGLSGKILAIGAVFFVISQIINTPLRIGTIKLLGLPEFGITAMFCFIAGFGEELSRYIAMRWVAPLKGNVSTHSALLYGFGHGGFEAVLFGLGVMMIAIIYFAGLGNVLTGDEDLASSLSEFGNVPVWHHLMGGIERVAALIIHLAASVIVAQVFLRRKWVFLPIAMGFHGVSNFMILSVHELTKSILLTEATAVVWALISLGIIRVLAEEPTTLVDKGESAAL